MAKKKTICLTIVASSGFVAIDVGTCEIVDCGIFGTIENDWQRVHMGSKGLCENIIKISVLGGFICGVIYRLVNIWRTQLNTIVIIFRYKLPAFYEWSYHGERRCIQSIKNYET